MRVIDSSVWVEILADGEAAEPLMELVPQDQTEIVLPAIVILEVAKWIGRESDDETRNRFFAFASQCVEAPLDMGLALRAADMHRDHKLATADAVVYATAITFDAELLTCDAHFKGLPRVIYVPNKAPAEPGR